MVEYQTILPPFSPAFLDELQLVGAEVLGSLDRDELVWRLTHLPGPSVQLARKGQLVGFKLGYADGRRRYHSWLGGVRAGWRRQGIALRLMDLQHDWLRSRGYVCVETSTMPDNAAMLSLNLRAGFRVMGTCRRGDAMRVMLVKALA